MLLRRACTKPPPDLAAWRHIVIEQANTQPCFGRDRRGCDPAGTGAHHDCVVIHSLRTSMAGTHNNWHVRR